MSEPIDLSWTEQRQRELSDLQALVYGMASLDDNAGVIERLQRMTSLAKSLCSSEPKRINFLMFLQAQSMLAARKEDR